MREPAQAGHLDDHAVPGPRQRRAFARAQQQHVAGRQRHEFGHVGQQPCGRAHQIGKTALPDLFTIDGHRERSRLCVKACAANEGAQRAETVAAALADGGAVVVLVRQREVAGDQPAGHMVQGRCFADARGAAADHQADAGIDADLARIGRHGHRSAIARPGIARLEIEHGSARSGLVGRAVELRRQALHGGLLVEQRAVDRAQRKAVIQEKGLNLHGVDLVNVVIIVFATSPVNTVDSGFSQAAAKSPCAANRAGA